MGIRKTKHDGKTRYVVTASRRNLKGKRYQRKRYAPNKYRAIALEKQLYHELDEEVSGNGKITWGDFIDDYYRIVEEREMYTPDTALSNASNLEHHVTPRWSKRKLLSITTDDVRNLIQDTVGDKKPATKQNLVKQIRGVFRMAEEKGYIDRNPAKGISYKKQKRTMRKLPNSKQIKRFITVARESNIPFYPLWHFLLLTGCRSGEAYALRWQSVDFEDRTIEICESWTRKGGFRSTTKTGDFRTIPISPTLRELLLELRQKTYVDERSFVLPRIREWTQGEAAKVLRAFLAGLELPEMRLHDLRGAFITEMLRLKGDVPLVMRLVSHKRLETTLRYIATAGIDVQGSTDGLRFLERDPNEEPPLDPEYESYLDSDFYKFELSEVIEEQERQESPNTPRRSAWDPETKHEIKERYRQNPPEPKGKDNGNNLLKHGNRKNKLTKK